MKISEYLKLPLERTETVLQINGFFDKLVDDDDWSTIIKLHAMFEGLLANTITEVLGKPQLLEAFIHIPMNDRYFGKIQILKILGLLLPDDARYLQKLGELRNDLVHDVTNCNFSLVQHVNMLDKNQFTSFYESFLHKDTIKNTDAIQNPAKFAKDFPKKAILLGAIGVCSSVYFGTLFSRTMPQVPPSNP